jgi:hypothetical protein
LLLLAFSFFDDEANPRRIDFLLLGETPCELSHDERAKRTRTRTTIFPRDRRFCFEQRW